MADQNAVDKARTSKTKRYFKDTVGELRKVVWPSREQTIKNTIAVLGTVLIIGMVIWIFDIVLGVGFSKLFMGIE